MDVSQTYLLLTAFAGFASSGITELIKKYSGVDSTKALITTLVVSLTLAFGAAWLTGELTAQGIVVGLSLVFSVATVFYKMILTKQL